LKFTKCIGRFSGVGPGVFNLTKYIRNLSHRRKGLIHLFSYPLSLRLPLNLDYIFGSTCSVEFNFTPVELRKEKGDKYSNMENTSLSSMHE
jgi:hypothetical protein